VRCEAAMGACGARCTSTCPNWILDVQRHPRSPKVSRRFPSLNDKKQRPEHDLARALLPLVVPVVVPFFKGYRWCQVVFGVLASGFVSRTSQFVLQASSTPKNFTTRSRERVWVAPHHHPLIQARQVVSPPSARKLRETPTLTA